MIRILIPLTLLLVVFALGGRLLTGPTVPAAVPEVATTSVVSTLDVVGEQEEVSEGPTTTQTPSTPSKIPAKTPASVPEEQVARETPQVQSPSVTTPLPAVGARSVCVNQNCSYATVAAAFDSTRDGDVVTISGEWTTGGMLRANNVTIRGTDNAHLKGGAVQGKAVMVIAGKSVTVENIECSGVTVPDQNGGCIRYEGGGDLTLRNVYFHDNETGLLATANTGHLLIENSIFERNGNNGSGGYAHGIYTNGGELTIRNSKFLRALRGGHEIKSRARRTVIENSVIASLDSEDSRNIDIANGGEVIIRNNVIQKSPNSQNSEAIGIGLEGVTHSNNSILVAGNYFILERERGNSLFFIKGMPEPQVTQNTIVGGADPGGNNTWYANRTAAGLAPYPYLPTL